MFPTISGSTPNSF
ncbi:hypothetical protein MTR67_016189 [Solanum verrucosum]|uniref:Uncharacterized protein n=1 Tax=Solanum verrucosum TaxID=315347 RepID=A0AAF0QMX6_SOLVR|nr:hypothetical protein MTR67_016189 [Solanum verrucosum]